MENTINILKPSVCFEVQRIVGISTGEGRCRSYQVQWAPSWISGAHLIGCEDLIEQFEREQNCKEHDIKVEVIDAKSSGDETGLAADANSSEDETVLTIIDREVEENVMQVETVNVEKQQCIESTRNSMFRNTGIAHKSNGNHAIHSRLQAQNISNKASSVPVAHVDSSIQNKKYDKIEEHSSKNAQVFILMSNMEDTGNNVSADEHTPYQHNHQPNNRETTHTSSDEDASIVIQATDNGHTGRSQPRQMVTYTKSASMDIVTSDAISEYYNTEVSEEENGKILEMQGKLNKSFGTETNTKFHIDIGNEYECHTCHRRFKSRLRLRRHELIHTDGKQFSCNLCSRMFTDNEKFLLHIEKHKVKDHRFKCAFCAKTCQTSADLQRHTRVHTAERPFECAVCLHKFQRKYHLQRHMRTHAQQDQSLSFSQENKSPCELQEDKPLNSVQEDKPHYAQEHKSQSDAQEHKSQSDAQEHKSQENNS